MTGRPEERKAGVAALFGRTAATYEQVVPFFTEPGRRLVELAGVAAGMRVLDLGCGRGAVTFPAAEAVGPAGEVVAGDLSAEMVALLRADVEARGLGNVDLAVIDAEDPPRDVGTFDRVLLAFVVFFLPDPVSALRRHVELLRPGGRLGLTTFPGTDERWRFWGEMLDELAPAHLRPVTAEDDPGPVGTPDRLAATLREVGCPQVDQREERYDVVFPEPDRWWDWVWSQGQRGALERIPPQDLPAFRDRALTRVRELARPDGSVTLEQRVTYTLADRP